MAFEDFTAAVWADNELDPNSDIAITDSVTLTVTTITENIDAWIYRDMGVGCMDTTNWSNGLKFTPDKVDDNASFCFWGIVYSYTFSF